MAARYLLSSLSHRQFLPQLVSADLAFLAFDHSVFPPALIAGSIETRSQQIKASVVETDEAYATAFCHRLV
jgi:hypothetical protein